MKEMSLPDPVSLKEALRKAIESGELVERLQELKARTEMSRSRLQELESTVDSLRQLLDLAQQDLAHTGEETRTDSTWNLLTEMVKTPTFQQLALEILANLLKEPPQQRP